MPPFAHRTDIVLQMLDDLEGHDNVECAFPFLIQLLLDRHSRRLLLQLLADLHGLGRPVNAVCVEPERAKLGNQRAGAAADIEDPARRDALEMLEDAVPAQDIARRRNPIERRHGRTEKGVLNDGAGLHLTHSSPSPGELR